MRKMPVDMEAEVLETVAQQGEVSNTEAFCGRFAPPLAHTDLVGCLRSLEACDMVVLEVGLR